MYTLVIRLNKKVLTFYQLDPEQVEYWIGRFAGRILNFAIVEGELDGVAHL